MPNSIKLGKKNFPWVEGIHVCSNKGRGPLKRGYKKNVKMG
jgi:hypothetical protein